VQADLSEIADVTHMATDIPELDQPGNRGLLRTRWLPIVMSDEACFQTIVLLAAYNMVLVKHMIGHSCNILQLKSEAIQCINKSIALRPEAQISDALVGAVAKMASLEAMEGNVESYRVHMRGLRCMLAARGGLSALGMSGLLRRMIIWIDLNSSLLLGVPRYYPGEAFSTEASPVPNIAQFVAL
jgi:hypothetical protein